MKYLTSKTWFDDVSTSEYERWMAAMSPIVNSVNTLQKTEELYTPYRATFCIPKISDYSYTKVQAINKSNNTRYDAMETAITFANGDKVTVSCPIEEANQYTGFYTAIAKYAMGNSNKVNNKSHLFSKKRISGSFFYKHITHQNAPESILISFCIKYTFIDFARLNSNDFVIYIT